MRGELDGQAIAQFVQHNREDFPRQLTIRANRRADFVEPDVGRLECLVEDIEAGCTHGGPANLRTARSFMLERLAENIVPLCRIWPRSTPLLNPAAGGALIFLGAA